MNPIVYDLIILVVLVLFALWGVHRGLVLSLFSLIAVLVALVGGGLIARTLSPLAVDFLEPKIASFMEERLTEALQDTELPAEIPLTDALDALERINLPDNVMNTIRDAVESGVTDAVSGSVSDAAANMASALTHSVAFLLIFLVAFVLILILWHVLARALNLVAKLPGLNTLNKLGGLVVGAFRGMLILFLCAWLVRWLGSSFIPAEAIEQSTLLRFFMTVNPLETLANL